MSAKHDLKKTIKLDDKSVEIIENFRKSHPFKVSRNAVANALIAAGAHVMKPSKKASK